MRLVFRGGAREVGRSCVELDAVDGRILFDCGLKLTEHDSEYPVGLEDVGDISAVFISHAHLDHTGALPVLHNKGLSCPVFATKATKELTKLILRDAFKIGKITGQHLGYAEADIGEVLACTKRVFVKTKGVVGCFSYKYFDAGHIPGSAAILVNVQEKKILYTGDINTSDTLLLDGADCSFVDVDVLICESTYGNRNHPSRLKTASAFIDEINSVIYRGGSVIIPVFALGRAQEIILLLANHKFNVPIYFDGMGIKATEIALANASDVRDEKALLSAFKKVRLVMRGSDRRAAMLSQSIIVTTSGMLTGGPVLHYINNMYDNPADAILLTGYQAENTNGRMLLESGKVFIDGFMRDVKCGVKQFDFSAHVGMSQIKDLVRKIRPKTVFFMHGDKESVDVLVEWANALGIHAFGPAVGESFNL